MQLAVDSKGTLYVGTGEANNSLDSYYGVGILRSTTTPGKSCADTPGWTCPVDSADNGAHSFRGAAVSKLLVDPENDQEIYAAVTEASNADDLAPTFGIYRSENGGDTWNLMIAGKATDLIYEFKSKTYFAAIRGRGIFKTDSNGHWIPTTSPFQCTISIADSNFYRASLAARDGTVWALISTQKGELSQPFPYDTGIVQSTDAGVTWKPLGIPATDLFNAQGNYDQFIAAPPESTALLVGGIDVWTTSRPQGYQTEWVNRTNSYSSSVHPDQHAIAVTDPRTWYVANDGGIWVTLNGGGGWSNLNSGLGAIQFISVTPLPNGLFLGGSQDNGTAATSGLRTGYEWETQFSGDGGYTSIDSDNPQQRFTENYFISLFLPRLPWL